MLAVLVETPLNSFLWLASIVLLLHSASSLEKKKDNEFPYCREDGIAEAGWMDLSNQGPTRETTGLSTQIMRKLA
jgi:hypothetical protein